MTRSVPFCAALIAGAALLLTACLPTVAPPYTGGLATEPTSLRPFVDEETGVNMAVPADWKAERASDPADGQLKAKIEKEGSSARMLVYCQGFMSRAGLPIKPLNLINDVTVSNERLWERKSMGGGNFDPEFSAWKGMVKAADGTLQPMHFYIAWKLDNLGSHCKYALWMIVGAAEAPQVEGDFLAMVRSLK